MSLKGLFLFFALIFLFYGCAVKKFPYEDLYSYLLEKGLSEKAITGKVFMEGEIFFLKDFHQGGFYGNFYIHKDKYLLILRPPFSSEYHLRWEKGWEGLSLIDFSKKRSYNVKMEPALAEKLPLYFLGLKETSLSFRKNSLQGNYTFERENLTGNLFTNFFHLKWKIKEISLLEGEFPNYNGQDFKEKSIELFF